MLRFGTTRVGLALVTVAWMPLPSTASGATGCDTIPVYADTEFADAAWSHSIIVDTYGSSTTSAVQKLTGGNPDAYGEGVHTFGAGLVRVAHLPQIGPIIPAAVTGVCSLTVTFDMRFLSRDFGSCGGSNPEVSFFALILQGGEFYAESTRRFVRQSDGGWVNDTRVDAATDFGHINLLTGAIDPLNNPDFSPAGAPLQVGILSSNSTGFPSCQITWGVDNFEVVAHVRGPTSIAGETWGRVKSRYR